MTDDRMDEIIRDAARDYNRPPAAGAPRDEIWARVQQARRAPRAEERAPMTAAPRREWIWRGVGIAAVLAIGIGIGRYVERSHPTVVDSSATPRVATATGRDSVRSPDSAVTTPATDDVSTPSKIDQTSGRRPQYAGTVVMPPTRSPLEPSTRGSAVDGAMPPSVSEGVDGIALRLALVKHLAGTQAMLTSFRTSARSGEVDAQLLAWARDLLRTTRLLQSSAATAHDPALRRLLDDLELVLLQISQYTAKASDHTQELELIERSIEKRGVIAKLRTTTTPAAFPAGT